MRSLVFPVREMPPHNITLPPPEDVTLSVQQSSQRSLRLLQTLTLQSKCCRQNLDTSLNINCQYVLFVQTSIIHSTKHQTRVNGRAGCLTLAEKIWHIFLGHNLHNQLCCSSHKCMFLTHVVPFKGQDIAPPFWFVQDEINTEMLTNGPVSGIGLMNQNQNRTCLPQNGWLWECTNLLSVLFYLAFCKWKPVPTGFTKCQIKHDRNCISLQYLIWNINEHH